MANSDERARRTIVGNTVEEWRARAERLSNGQLKAIVLRVQQAINTMDFTRKVSDETRKADEDVLAGLLRRQSIARSILTARGYHKKEDNKDFSEWLDREARPQR